MKIIFFLSLLILILGLSSCGTVVYVGDQNNPIDVEYALKNIEQYTDKPVYIKCYPVAYKTYKNFTGSKLINVYFSDLKSDYRGVLDLLDSIGNWVDAFVHEDAPLWIEVLPVFLPKLNLNR